MSDTIEVRDHSQPCEHDDGDRWQDRYSGIWECDDSACPGGRRIVLRSVLGERLLTDEYYWVVVSDDE